MHIAREISSLQFVYPFVFDSDTYTDRLQTVDTAAWPDEKGSLTVWRKKAFPVDDLMAHVGRYLNPPAGVEPTARMWCIDARALNSGRGLAFDSNGKQSRLVLHALHQDIEFGVDGFDLALFHTGTGFLTISAKPQCGEPDSWLDFLHAFRFLNRPREVHVCVERRGSDGKMSASFPAPAGGLAAHPNGKGALSEIIDVLLRTGSVASDSGTWWREVYVPGRLLPFASIFSDDAPDDVIRPFRYRVRNFFHAKQGINPTEADLRDDQSGMLAYAERQWFLFSLDGGAFVAFDAPDTRFFRENLPTHLHGQYFLLLLLALHQRFVLVRLSEEVAENWPVRDAGEGFDERVRLFRQTQRSLLAFTARGYFAQIVQREHHHRVYQKWQETFQLDRLYDEVRTEVSEMHNYLLMLRTEEIERMQQEQQLHAEAQARLDAERERAAAERAGGLERRISYLGIFIGVPALIIGFLGINLTGLTSSGPGLPTWQALLIVIAGTLLLGNTVLLAVSRGWSWREERRQ